MHATLKQPKAVAKNTGARVEAIVPKLRIREMKLTIMGDSPLLCNRFGEKNIEKIKAKQTGVASSGREKRDFEAEYQASIYRDDDGNPAFPASGIQKAAVSAAPDTDFLSKTAARRAFRVKGTFIRIKGAPRHRQDTVRLNGRSADLRSRAEFPQWSMEFAIRFNEAVISVPQLVFLFNLAGFAIGIGDRRPEKDGSFGMFHVKEGEQ